MTESVGFNAYELDVIQELRKKEGWSTTNNLADCAGMAWETAGKTLNSLYEKGYLVKGKKKNRLFWRLY